MRKDCYDIRVERGGNVKKSSGLVLLNKKAGVTSFEALGRIKRVLGTGKVGHTGTLDKFAQGLLVVLVGRALKLSPWFSNCDKQYLGRICFGIETDTLDPEGSPIAEAAVPARENVEQVLNRFSGSIMQAPPAYSAIHVNGKRASDLARSGKMLEMKKRPIFIYKLELLCWEPPFAEIFVSCSSGTYIRSLSRDIALAAGSRAHLCSLTRTQVAGFSLDMACSSGLESENGRGTDFLRPIDRTVIAALGLPRFDIAFSEAEKIICGMPLDPILDGMPLFSRCESLSTADFTAAVFSEEVLVAIVEKKSGKWKYGRVLGSEQ
jgi:tRNA pseudouridine55 synthase